MITQLFPVDFFIKIRPPNFEEILSKVATLDSDSIEGEKWSVNCNVETIRLDQSEWVPILTPGVKKFFRQIGWQGNVIIQRPWINFYNRGCLNLSSWAR